MQANAPTASADTYGLKAGTSFAETAKYGVLANDADHNGLSLTAALAANGGPSHGSLALNQDGS